MDENYALNIARRELGIVSNEPTAAQVVADERAELEDARNAAYPVPDSPHASVNLRVVAERTGFTRGWKAHAALEVAPMPADSDANAPWLTIAHIICSDAGIPSGHISERLEALCKKLGPPVQAQKNMVPISADGKSVWIDGVGDVALVQAQEPDDRSMPADMPQANRWIVQLRARIESLLAVINSPVQPVAVPDGSKSELSAYQYWASKQKGGFAPIDAWLARAELAAPAAQGDAKDAELTDRQILRMAMKYSTPTKFGREFDEDTCVEFARAAIADSKAGAR